MFLTTALNLMSQFNLENITVFASQSSDAKAVSHTLVVTVLI